MKTVNLIFVGALLIIACKNDAQTISHTDFKSERVSKTAMIILNAQIEKVFPLFGAFEERKWAQGWSPVLIYPSKEVIEEGTTFKTQGHGHGENEFLWLVSKLDGEKHIIQYLVYSQNRYWTITIKCNNAENHKTQAEITYSFTGLNESGNEIDNHFIERIYERGLKDWEDAINFYLSTGKTKPH